MAKEGLITAKEKLIPVGKKVLPLISKVGAKLSLFCKSTLIPFYHQKIKPNPKPFLIALLILLLLGGGFLIFQQKSSSKKISEVSSLENLAKRFEIWAQSYKPAKSSSKEVFGKWLKEGLELANQYKKSVENYLSLSQDLNPKYPEKFKELFEKDKTIRDIEGHVELSGLFDLRETKEGEMIYKIFNESQILLNKVKITEGDGKISIFNSEGTEICYYDVDRDSKTGPIRGFEKVKRLDKSAFDDFCRVTNRLEVQTRLKSDSVATKADPRLLELVDIAAIKLPEPPEKIIETKPKIKEARAKLTQ